MPPNSAKLQLGSNSKPDETRGSGEANKMIQQLRVETVSCYRSSGSVPIPKPSPIINSFVKPKAPKKAEVILNIQEAAELIEEIDTEEVHVLGVQLQESELVSLTEVKAPFPGDRAGKMYIPKVLICEKVEETPDQISELPAKKSQPEEQKCRKHSRCHCHLFSLETSGFFSVAQTNLAIV